MRKPGVTQCILALMIVVFLLSGTIPVYAQEGKVPITTSSDKALKLYLEGRDLAERLRGQEARQFFEKAVAEDPGFALAYLNLSTTQPTAKGFQEKLGKALKLADKVSEGERLMILAIQAGSNADPMQQREYYQKLVAAFPKDERPHNLLGNNYFGAQLYAEAIEQYNKAIKINAEFSQPYNQLGYAHRFLENYADAEKAFKKYIELIPDDPNPYDSYAELLMKMGKYDKSIEFYRKALKVNPTFAPSHIGIATNLNFKGQHEKARKQLQKLYDNALDVGQQRAAHFATAVSHVDEGNTDLALKELKKQYSLAEKDNDVQAMAGDFIAMGNILLESGKYEKALAHYEKAVKQVEGSTLPEKIKENFRRNLLYNSGRVALKQQNFATAKAKADEYRKLVEALRNAFQIRLAHEFAGMIALAKGDQETALAEFKLANLQNPYNLYRMSLAYQSKGDHKQARELCEKAAHYNALNSLNYAFIRSKAEQTLLEM